MYVFFSSVFQSGGKQDNEALFLTTNTQLPVYLIVCYRDVGDLQGVVRVE